MLLSAQVPIFSAAPSTGSTASTGVPSPLDEGSSMLRWGGQRSRVAAAILLAFMTVSATAGPAQADLGGYGTLLSNQKLLDGLGISGKDVNHVLDEQINIDMGPAMTQLRYSFCNAQSCGTSENLECTGNLYIPGFVGSILKSAQVPPPGRLSKLLAFALAHGPSAPTGWFAGRGSGANPFASLGQMFPGSSAGGDGVKLDFGLGDFAPALRPMAPFGDGCGVPENQVNDVKSKNPDGI
jgi:hypothetical protein